MFHILIVEDDFSTRRLMDVVLQQAGYRTSLAADGAEALRVLDRQKVDLVLLDIMMPKMDGYELTRQIRQADEQLPLLMVTAKLLQEDKKRGFLVGTDDYMTKPVDHEEMLLRIKALLRRAKIVSEQKLVLGEVTLDYRSLTVTRAGDTQTLPQKEFYLLYKLLSYPGKTFTRLDLMDDIWGMDTESDDATVTVHINRLRRRFSSYPEFEIITVHGLGYKAVRRG